MNAPATIDEIRKALDGNEALQLQLMMDILGGAVAQSDQFCDELFAVSKAFNDSFAGLDRAAHPAPVTLYRSRNASVYTAGGVL